MAACSTPDVAISPRVLIAEDQPEVIEAIRLVLKQEGIHCEAVTSPEAALAALSSQEFDLVLMDLNYTRDTTSGSEGLELLNRLQQENSSVPIIVMTAWGSVEVAVEAMRRGACDFIQKPWDNWRLLGLVRNQLERGQQVVRAEAEHDREMREAGDIQKRLLPRHITQIPGLDISADWKPARVLGGDYFDILRFADGSVGLCIADVEGKGVPAALVMSNLQSAVKAFATPAIEPEQLCRRLNTIFCEDVQTERFISLCYARLEPANRRLTFTNAGHCPPLLMRANGQTEKLERGGAVLGRLPGWKYEQGEVTLGANDVLVLFTDGVTEAENSEQQEFGEERLTACVRSCGEMTAAGLQRELLAQVAKHCGNRFHDDATLMIVAVR
ncbi:MAG TPA: SpoIIE family protein phosphatase [Terriglobales bacterium]|nr:SpoIIE family protein phosphatase [Terriglobales bacterium]